MNQPAERKEGLRLLGTAPPTYCPPAAAAAAAALNIQKIVTNIF